MSSTTDTHKQCSVIIIGCGCPLRSMGWYHAEQLLRNRCPSAQLQYIVEPYYMNPQFCNNDTNYENSIQSISGFKEFHMWKQYCETTYNIQFFYTIDQIPSKENEIDESKKNMNRMVLICARTNDNPKLFNDCIENYNTIQCSVIYLEKPGATTVSELITMKNNAFTKNITAYVGFNKNVSSYVTHTLSYASDYKSTHANNTNNKLDITFVHNNAYENTKSVLAECFERNSEGILKNMAIHELAIVVTYFDVTVVTIDKVIADIEYSSCQTLIGPSSNKSYTDFDKLKFKVITKSNNEVTIIADRCGGDTSIGILSLASTSTDTSSSSEENNNNNVLVQYTMPDETTVAAIPSLASLYDTSIPENQLAYGTTGTIMPYFLTQDPDYCEIKERIAYSCANSKNTSSDTSTVLPKGAATIQIAIDALQLAEYLTPLLQEQLK